MNIWAYTHTGWFWTLWAYDHFSIICLFTHLKILKENFAFFFFKKKIICVCFILPCRMSFFLLIDVCGCEKRRPSWSSTKLSGVPCWVWLMLLSLLWVGLLKDDSGLSANSWLILKDQTWIAQHTFWFVSVCASREECVP